MAVTLWDYINNDLDGKLLTLLQQWYVEEGIGTPTMAKRLNSMGYDVEQRTVWRWIKQQDLAKKGAK